MTDKDIKAIIAGILLAMVVMILLALAGWDWYSKPAPLRCC